MSRHNLKTAAKEQIKGTYGMFFLLLLLIAAVYAGFSALTGINATYSLIYVGNTPLSVRNISANSSLYELLNAVCQFVFSYAAVYMAHNLTMGVKPVAGDIFIAFKNIGNVLLLYFLMGLFTTLWSLLFLFPGIVKAYAYSMAPYILKEYPNTSPLDAIRQSKDMMRGKKGDLFVLDLSFIGWGFLSVITAGIVYIFVMPYYYTTVANFYNSIKPVPCAQTTPYFAEDDGSAPTD